MSGTAFWTRLTLFFVGWIARGGSSHGEPRSGLSPPFTVGCDVDQVSPGYWLGIFYHPLTDFRLPVASGFIGSDWPTRITPLPSGLAALRVY